LANGGGKWLLATLLQQTTVRLRLKSLTFMCPQLTAADTLRISDVHHFWGSFWPSNLADQMQLILGQSSI
jgi:hypothetical protein